MCVSLVQVLDGRRATGGKLEVRVKIREPLGGVQLQPVTEKWLVIDPLTPSPEKERERNKDTEKERVCKRLMFYSVMFDLFL